MKKDALEVLNRNIVVEGCVFGENALTFDVVDEATLTQASLCLQVVEKCKEWWWGDFLVAWAQWRLERDFDAKELAAMSEQDQHERRCHYVRSHGSVLHGEELADTQLKRYRVANFYNSRMRMRELTVWHHVVAMDGSDGDKAVAQDWLDKAKAAGWSGNELRAEIKAAKKAQISDPPSKVASLQHELFGAERWAQATLKRVDAMDVDEIDRTAANIERLAAKLSTLAAALAAARVGKESLSAAA